MLTCCGCVANAEQTEIVTPCQLHAQWAMGLTTREAPSAHVNQTTHTVQLGTLPRKGAR